MSSVVDAVYGCQICHQFPKITWGTSTRSLKRKVFVILYIKKCITVLLFGIDNTLLIRKQHSKSSFFSQPCSDMTSSRPLIWNRVRFHALGYMYVLALWFACIHIPPSLERDYFCTSLRKEGNSIQNNCKTKLSIHNTLSQTEVYIILYTISCCCGKSLSTRHWYFLKDSLRQRC